MPTFFHHALLARARLDLGMTQEEAAAAAGVDVRTYRRYESGEVNDPEQGFTVRQPSRRRLLQRLARELGVDEGELLIEREAVIEAPIAPRGWTPRHVHTLPRARHFVGRAREIEAIVAFQKASRGGVLAIVALGGAGKTSVIERALARIGDGPHAGGVLVWSFYEEPRIEAFFAEALATFGGDRAASIAEAPALIMDALRSGPHLVVLDGMEVVQGSGAPGTTFGRIEDPALRRLLSAIARGLGGARAICTSRLPLTDLAAWEGEGLTTIALGPLAEGEGADLLARWGLAGGPEALAPIAAKVGGHALSVAMMGSYAGTFLGGDVARVASVELEPAARDDATARRLLSVLGAYARALPEVDRDLLSRLSLFPSGATVEVLLAIAAAGEIVGGATNGLDRPAISASLARLTRLGLASGSRGGERWSAHPFVAQYFQSILGVPAAKVHAATRDALAARLDVHRAGVTEITLLDAYEALLDHTRAAGRVEEAWSLYARALGGFGHLGLRLGEMRRGLRVVAGFFEEGDPARPPADLSVLSRLRLVYDLGLYAGALGDLDRAARAYRAHNDLARAQGILGALATGLRTLAYTERLRGALDDALALTRASADLAVGAGRHADHVRAIALSAAVLHDLGRVEEAERAFDEVRRLGDEPFARRGLWEAEHLLDRGRIEEARALTLRNVEVCKELGWEGHAAHGEAVLGLAALAVSPPDVAEAAQRLAAARRWTAATGEVEMVLRGLDLEARLALAEGSVERARAVIDEGRDLAAATGFGLFTARFASLLAPA